MWVFHLTKIRSVSVKRLSGRRKSDCWTDNARTVRMDVWLSRLRVCVVIISGLLSSGVCVSVRRLLPTNQLMVAAEGQLSRYWLGSGEQKPESTGRHQHGSAVAVMMLLPGDEHKHTRVGWSVVVHRTVLQLHSKTEQQDSAEHLKQLETWFKMWKCLRTRPVWSKSPEALRSQTDLNKAPFRWEMCHICSKIKAARCHLVYLSFPKSHHWGTWSTKFGVNRDVQHMRRKNIYPVMSVSVAGEEETLLHQWSGYWRFSRLWWLSRCETYLDQEVDIFGCFCWFPPDLEGRRVSVQNRICCRSRWRGHISWTHNIFTNLSQLKQDCWASAEVCTLTATNSLLKSKCKPSCQSKLLALTHCRLCNRSVKIKIDQTDFNTLDTYKNLCNLSWGSLKSTHDVSAVITHWNFTVVVYCKSVSHLITVVWFQSFDAWWWAEGIIARYVEIMRQFVFLWSVWRRACYN